MSDEVRLHRQERQSESQDTKIHWLNRIQYKDTVVFISFRKLCFYLFCYRSNDTSYYFVLCRIV